MNPLKLLEKAINEHGSSAILNERLELVNDQLQRNEREKSEMEDEIVKLKKENESLKQRISEIESTAAGVNPEEKQILLYLAENGNGLSLTQSHIQSGTGININRLKLHLSKLENKGYICGHHSFMNRKSEYSLSSNGTEYLIEINEL